MASYYQEKHRAGFRAQLYVRGVRRKLWLGPISKSAAGAVCRHLEAINAARDTGTIPPAETRRWLDIISPRIRNQLASWGLIEATQTKQLPNSLGAFTQAYIDSRDDWKERSVSRMSNVRRQMVDHFGSATTLGAITPGECERFARQMRKQYSSSHAGKLIADARQYLAAAVKDRLIELNPFEGIDSRQAHRKDREAYVTPEAIDKIIAKACPYYAALIAIVRYGGLRCPSEPLAITWRHIDWDAGRVTVESTKTGIRVMPLMPEFRGYLERLYELAPDNSVYAFDRYRTTAAKVYAAALKRLIRAAGVAPWPKLWMNLRASCRTDLLESFPTHVVNAWLGHSSKVGSKHYDRIHDGHFAKACGVAGGVASPPTVASARSPDG